MHPVTTRLLVAATVIWFALGAITSAQKANVPKPQDKLALGQKHIEELLALMDSDKNGKISKQEFMTFMEAEFDRLDKDKSGQLDVKELTKSRLQASQFAKTGK